jgi:hypothetical protein
MSRVKVSAPVLMAVSIVERMAATTATNRNPPPRIPALEAMISEMRGWERPRLDRRGSERMPMNTTRP